MPHARQRGWHRKDALGIDPEFRERAFRVALDVRKHRRVDAPVGEVDEPARDRVLTRPAPRGQRGQRGRGRRRADGVQFEGNVFAEVGCRRERLDQIHAQAVDEHQHVVLGGADRRLDPLGTGTEFDRLRTRERQERAREVDRIGHVSAGPDERTVVEPREQARHVAHQSGAPFMPISPLMNCTSPRCSDVCPIAKNAIVSAFDMTSTPRYTPVKNGSLISAAASASLSDST